MTTTTNTTDLGDELAEYEAEDREWEILLEADERWWDQASLCAQITGPTPQERSTFIAAARARWDATTQAPAPRADGRYRVTAADRAAYAAATNTKIAKTR